MGLLPEIPGKTEEEGENFKQQRVDRYWSLETVDGGLFSLCLYIEYVSVYNKVFFKK